MGGPPAVGAHVTINSHRLRDRLCLGALDELVRPFEAGLDARSGEMVPGIGPLELPRNREEHNSEDDQDQTVDQSETLEKIDCRHDEEDDPNDQTDDTDDRPCCARCTHS